MAVTFLEVLPFTQVIVTFLAAAGLTVATGEGVGAGAASCVNFTRTVGEENVKP